MLLVGDAFRSDGAMTVTAKFTDDDDESNDRIAASRRQGLLIRQVVDNVIELRLHRCLCPESDSGSCVQNCSGQRSAAERLSSSLSSSSASFTEDDRARRRKFHNDFNQHQHLSTDCQVHSQQLLRQESFRNDECGDAPRRRPASCPCLSTAMEGASQPADCQRHRGPEDATDQTGELERWQHESADRRTPHDNCLHHRRPQQQQQLVLGQVLQRRPDSQVFGTPVEATEHRGIGTTPEAVDAVAVAVESLQASSCGTASHVWNDGRSRTVGEQSPQRRIEASRRSRSPRRRAAVVTRPVVILAIVCTVIALVSIVAGIGVCTGHVDNALGFVLIGKQSWGQCVL